MSTIKGYFKFNLPFVKIKLYGMREELAQEFEALIDTGSNSHIIVPFDRGLPLGLTLMGYAPTATASPVTDFIMLCEGNAVIGEETINTGVNVNFGTYTIIGNQFLKQLNRDLHIDFANDIVELRDK